MAEAIPAPPGWPIVGNVTDIDAEFPLGSLVHLADLYGIVDGQRNRELG